MIMVLPHGVELGLPSGLSHSWTPTRTYTCDGCMAARRLPRGVRRSAALLPQLPEAFQTIANCSRKLKQLPALKTTRYKTRRL